MNGALQRVSLRLFDCSTFVTVAAARLLVLMMMVNILTGRRFDGQRLRANVSLSDRFGDGEDLAGLLVDVLPFCLSRMPARIAS